MTYARSGRVFGSDRAVAVSDEVHVEIVWQVGYGKSTTDTSHATCLHQRSGSDFFKRGFSF
jgi:hypothetical protein